MSKTLYFYAFPFELDMHWLMFQMFIWLCNLNKMKGNSVLGFHYYTQCTYLVKYLNDVFKSVDKK